MIAAMLLLAIAAHGAPIPHPTACPTPAVLPAGVESWAQPRPIRAGASGSDAATLMVGTAVTATLLPTPAVTYPVRPEKPGTAVSSGGLFAFAVPNAGRYRVMLGSGAWIDVLSGTTPAASIAHGHGPQCSTIRKTVDFDLQPGRHLLQVAGANDPTLGVMIVPVP